MEQKSITQFLRQKTQSVILGNPAAREAASQLPTFFLGAWKEIHPQSQRLYVQCQIGSSKEFPHQQIS
jgi:hypothetical protein